MMLYEVNLSFSDAPEPGYWLSAEPEALLALFPWLKAWKAAIRRGEFELAQRADQSELRIRPLGEHEAMPYDAPPLMQSVADWQDRARYVPAVEKAIRVILDSGATVAGSLRSLVWSGEGMGVRVQVYPEWRALLEANGVAHDGGCVANAFGVNRVHEIDRRRLWPDLEVV